MPCLPWVGPWLPDGAHPFRPSNRRWRCCGCAAPTPRGCRAMSSSTISRSLRNATVPVLLLHGDQDRLVPIAAARATAAANPTWSFEVARGVGHVPQLELPEWTTGQILGWLDNDGAAAAYAASPDSRRI